MQVSYAIVGAQQAAAGLRAVGPRITQAAVQTVTRLTYELEAYVKSQKLSGQVLHVRSGNLRNSVNSQFDNDGTRFTGRVGTGIVYARIHEFGGTIERVSQPGVVRLRTNAAGELLRQATEGRLANLAVFAKASHKRYREVAYEGGKEYTITLKERSFLRSALADRREAILEALKKSVREALK